MRVSSEGITVHGAGDANSFRLMSNAMDIASSVGEAADALSRDFGIHTEATAAAFRFVEDFKSANGLRHSLSGGMAVNNRSARGWAEYHAGCLREAFALYAHLRAHSAAAAGRSHVEPLTRLSSKLALGYRLGSVETREAA